MVGTDATGTGTLGHHVFQPSMFWHQEDGSNGCERDHTQNQIDRPLGGMRHVMVVIFFAMALVVVIVTVMVVPHHLGQIMIVRLGPAADPEPHPEGVVRRETGREQSDSAENGTSVGKSLGQDDILGP